MTINELINISPYKFSKKEKVAYFLKGIKELTKLHKKKCKEYNKILNLINYGKFNKSNLSEYPFDLITTTIISAIKSLDMNYPLLYLQIFH